MRRTLAVVALLAIGCGGDENTRCDPGTTMNVDGVCIANPVSPVTCTDGTILVDNHCEIDPAACQDGTVLVGGACVDPGSVTADVEEAAEPNGLGSIGETSTAGAGMLTLKPAGQQLVIHGKIIPFRDLDMDGQQDADADAYTLQVSAPTMLSISADGLHGLAAGFVSFALVDATSPMADWFRLGMNLTGDASKRQLYLPVAGTYLITVADTRSLLLNGGAAGAPTGKPDFEYYVSIEQLAVSPVALTVTSGVATSTGTRQPGEVKLFTVAMGEGINSAELSAVVEQVEESLVIANTRGSATSIKGVDDGGAGDTNPAELAVIGMRTGDQTVIVVDSVYDYANQPHAYTLTVDVGTAAALSTNGGTASQPASASAFTVFYYDVAAALGTIGMDVAFNVPVSGVIVDENFEIFSNFTYDPFDGFSNLDTFESYRGLLRHRTAGRYYFVVFDPTDTATTLTATSRYDALSPTPIVKGTPLTNQAVNAYQSNAFTYDAGTVDAWQQFNATGTGTGGLRVVYWDPDDAFGRLDTLTNTCGAACDDIPDPIFFTTHAETGTPRGRILLDDGTTSYFATVNTQTVTGAPTFSLSFTRRDHSDLGTAVVGTPITRLDQALDGTTTTQRYIVRTTAGYGLSITADPDQVALDPRIQQVANNESALGPLVDNGAAGEADILQVLQTGNGWTAFTVTAANAIAGGTFDLTVNAANAVNYQTAAGATVFADACTGGATVGVSDLDDGASFAAIAVPAGFDFYGLPVAQLKVFTNGFASFDTTTPCTLGCFATNQDMPRGAQPNAIVAPYWDDLEVAAVGGICQKTIGTKLVIQWRGVEFATNDAVEFQMIIDGANDTIEFVYGTNQVGDGDFATIGIESQGGVLAEKLGFNTSNAATGTLFTPM